MPFLTIKVPSRAASKSQTPLIVRRERPLHDDLTTGGSNLYERQFHREKSRIVKSNTPVRMSICEVLEKNPGSKKGRQKQGCFSRLIFYDNDAAVQTCYGSRPGALVFVKTPAQAKAAAGRACASVPPGTKFGRHRSKRSRR
jgi:hypothetical protein